MTELKPRPLPDKILLSRINSHCWIAEPAETKDGYFTAFGENPYKALELFEISLQEEPKP